MGYAAECRDADCRDQGIKLRILLRRDPGGGSINPEPEGRVPDGTPEKVSIKGGIGVPHWPWEWAGSCPPKIYAEGKSLGEETEYPGRGEVKVFGTFMKP